MTEPRRRWWQDGELSIQQERAWFAACGLDFELDAGLLADHELVVFRGELRLGDQSTSAAVIYPPAYGHGANPLVEAPDLAVGRHKSPSGHLCLDHPVAGTVEPMSGAEAVQRAERLWLLWETDREQLAAEEAEAPDPAANYYTYDNDTAVTLLDVDVTGDEHGFFNMQASTLKPLRAVVTRVRTVRPEPRETDRTDQLKGLAGPLELSGPWRRVSEAPPHAPPELGAWLKDNYLVAGREQVRFAKDAGRAAHAPELPAILAFVYPDEGPARGEVHDAWLFVTIDPHKGAIGVARSFHLRDSERWLRQPHMSGLSDKSVAIVGVGALGSHIADLLAKAGLGSFFLVDADIVSAGNRIRHVLDLSDVGRAKVHGVAQRLLSANPWCDAEVSPRRLGAPFAHDSPLSGQKAEDAVAVRLGETDLIINATANRVAGLQLSALGSETDTPVLHTWVSAGAWAARVLLQRPGSSGCWECLALAQEPEDRYEGDTAVPDAPSDPNAGEVTDLGCADPTFTGPGFELASAAAAAARIAVQALVGDNGAYPAAQFDLATLTFQTGVVAEPSAHYTLLPVHTNCTTCRPPA